jgi:hypothetical protein
MTLPRRVRLCSSLLLFLLAGCAGTPPAESERPVELFDGATLTGWTTIGGRYDGNAHWTVEDGALTGRQGAGREGGLIYTAVPYADFAFEVDVKIDWPFDSGIFLRMTPQAKGMQVTIDNREGGECGGLYADGWVLHNPEGWKHFKRGEWNHFEVRCVGEPMQVAAFLNGELLVHHTLDSAEGYARTGLIGLQVHGGEKVPLETKVQFRGMRVRELEALGFHALGYGGE